MPSKGVPLLCQNDSLSGVISDMTRFHRHVPTPNLLCYEMVPLLSPSVIQHTSTSNTMSRKANLYPEIRNMCLFLSKQMAALPRMKGTIVVSLLSGWLVSFVRVYFVCSGTITNDRLGDLNNRHLFSVLEAGSSRSGCPHDRFPQSLFLLCFKPF